MAPMAETAGARLERLLDIMRTLRAPDGCPWDREQTHASLRPYVLEETYELLEAIDSGSADQLREELGDFIFEAVFLAQISQEAGDFDFGDALDAVSDKLVRRHPHVFARSAPDETVTTGQVIERWEALKARERAEAGRPAARPKTTLSGVPKTLPALLRAYEIGARAAAVGFDWQKAGDVLDKIEEEVAELPTPRDLRTRVPREWRSFLSTWCVTCSAYGWVSLESLSVGARSTRRAVHAR
jgi:MazG family protein